MLKRWLRRVYAGRLMPWFLRWALPPERPMLMIVGRRGKGKTAIATKIAQGRMLAGERVYANYDIEVPGRGLRAGRIFSLLDCLDLLNCTIVIDEANLWTNAREWSKIPSSVLSSWQQSRKRGVSFIFTTQHEERCDKVIRELADYLLLCERMAFVPKWVPLFRVQRTYLEEIDEVRRGAVSRPEYYWLGDRVLGGYDTREDVDNEQLDSLNEYVKALKAGKDPDALSVALPARVEPAYFDDVLQEWAALPA